MRRRSYTPGGTPISSLIDVVFLLIIFFVVTAAQEKDIIDRTIQLAEAEYAPPTEDRDPQTIILNLRKDGSLNIAKRPVSLSQLRSILRGTYQDAGGNVPILIRSDGATPYRYVDEIETVVKESGFYRVQLAAVVEQENP